MNRRRPIAVFLILTLPFMNHAKETGAAFLTLSPSVRAEALGGVGILSVGAEAMGVNPAQAVPPTTPSQVYTLFAPMDDQTSFGQVAWAGAFGKRRTGVGVAFTHMRSEPDPAYDSTGANSGQEFTASDTAVALCVSGRGWQGIRWGLAGKVIQSELAGVQSKPTGALDAGVHVPLKNGGLGATITSLGPGQKFLDQTDPLPTTFRLELAWQPRPVSLLLGIQREMMGSETRMGLGVEYRWKAFQLRAGYNRGTEDSADRLFWEDLSAGMGMAITPAFQIDYSVRESDLETGLLHRAALTWSWGTPVSPPSAKPKKHQRTTPQKVQPSPKKTAPPPPPQNPSKPQKKNNKRLTVK